jgi:hypothetical protein
MYYMKTNLLSILILVAFPSLLLAQQTRGGSQINRTGRVPNGRGYSVNYDYQVQYGSALSIFSETGEPFFLLLNGIRQNGYPQSRIRIEGLPDVVNDIQVIFDDDQTPSISRRISFIDPVEGGPVNLVLRLTRDRQGYGRLAFHKLTPLENNYVGERTEFITNYCRKPVQVDPQGRNQLPTPPIPTAMDDRTFVSAKQAIRGSSWDDTRLSTAQTIINNNYLNTDQVIEICRMFSWDDTKLAFAKYAFKRTIDNNNYFRVNAVFDWDSNKKLLNDYVNANR